MTSVDKEQIQRRNKIVNAANMLVAPIRQLVRETPNRRDRGYIMKDAIRDGIALASVRHESLYREIIDLGGSLASAIDCVHGEKPEDDGNFGRIYRSGLSIFEDVEDGVTRELLAYLYLRNIVFESDGRLKSFSGIETENLEADHMLRVLGQGETRATSKQLRKLKLGTVLEIALSGNLMPAAPEGFVPPHPEHP